MCASLDLFATNSQQHIVILSQQRLFCLTTPLSVDAFPDQQRRRVLLHGGSTNAARDERRDDFCPLFLAQVMLSERTQTTWGITAGFDDSSQMFMATTAAATNNIDSELGNEIAQCRRHWFRLHWINCQTVDIERNARVRNRRDGQGTIFCQETHRFAHMLWSRRAIQSNNIDTQCHQRCHHCRDISTEQHTSTCIKRNLGLNRNSPSHLLHSAAHTCNGCTYLKDILARLNKQHINATFEQRRSLFTEHFDQLLVRDVAQERIIGRRKHSCRANRASNKAWLDRRAIAISKATC